MKHIRTFDSYRNVKNKMASVDPSILSQAIRESVLQVGDLYKVRSMVDIPQSLINSYVKKVKDTTGKNLRQFFGDVEIAEQLLQYITTTGLDIEKIPGNALMGGAQGQGQVQAQGGQVQVQAETGEGTEVQEPATQAQGQPAEGQAPAGEEFEEPAQAQGQAPALGQAAQGQAQGQAPQGQGQAAQGQAPAQGQATQGQGQAQGQAPQGQGQAQGQAPAQGQEEEEEGEEELPV